MSGEGATANAAASSCPWPTSYHDDDRPFPSALLLAVASALLLTSSLLFGHVGSGSPRPQLGRRQGGDGLISYLIGYVRPGGPGVWGYDTSLGSMSPPIRVACHTSVMLALWSVAAAALPLLGAIGIDVEGSDGKEEGACPAPPTTASVLFTGATVASAYLLFNIAIWMLLPGVSHPGGPREAKIPRMPLWDAPARPSSSSSSSGTKGGRWTCRVAEDSHRATEGSFSGRIEQNGGAEKNGGGSGPKLTGEPFGRQIWTWDEDGGALSSSSGSGPDENAVLEMASGGRPHSGFDPSVNPNSCDRVFRAQMIRQYLRSGKTPPDVTSRPRDSKEAARKALHFYSMLQTEDGHWAGDYGGPHFLMPGLIVAWYVMGKPSSVLDHKQVDMMTRYLLNHQQSDGGWGTHVESPSTMFGTTLSYVALRLMGKDPDDPAMQRGRAFIREQGGAVMTSSWAKFSLCLLGAMEWDGHNVVPPEMWLLPSWTPFHPGRLWCHCRMVYLPMGYLYGAKFVYDKAETDPVVLGLREELYTRPYGEIDWDKTRFMVAEMDNYSPIPLTMAFLQNCLALYEHSALLRPLRNWVRAKGLKFCLEYMRAEDLQTNYIDIGPVNKVFNFLSAYHAAGGNINDPACQAHAMRVPDYLWVAEDGMKMQGYNGSQCWDTSFAIQAVMECGLLDKFPEVSAKVWSYLERTQILSTETSQSSPAYEYESPESRDMYYRHVSEGGWPFSTSAHGWPISDCTGEGLKSVLALLEHSKSIQAGLKDGSLRPINQKRLCDAANVILTLQNEDGGWATYENNRGFGWYEALNPSEVFGDIMIDYSYVECSMASLTALADFRDHVPDHRREEIDASIARGRKFMKSIQRPDGSWYGSWACCFCYGCWFGVEGLIRAGEPRDSEPIARARAFLLRHQRPNGGWGEDFTSCYDKDYAADGMRDYGDEGSGVVNTAWALLALSAAGMEEDLETVRKGVRYLIQRQLPCGDWPQEGIAGVFNRACGITYTAYRNVFPMWALGRCREAYKEALDKEG